MSNAVCSINLENLVAAAQLPALPQSAIRLLELSRDPDNGPAEFALPIESDPGLAGQVLRFVNSSYFGFSREISSVKLAITLVGIRTIKNFSLWSAVFSLMPNPRCGPFAVKTLWQDSLRRGLFARAFGKSLGLKDAEDLFAAALLQDMAVPLLAKALPELYQELLTAREGGGARLSELEQRQFGWTHAEAAGLVARAWSLPEQFAVWVEGHTQLDRWLMEGEGDPGLLAVSLSALLPSEHDGSWSEYGQFAAAYHRLAGNNAPRLPEMLARIDGEFQEFAPVLKLPTPAKSLLASFEQEAAASA